MLHIENIKENTKVKDSQDGRVGVVSEVIEADIRYKVKTNAPIVPKVIVDFGNYKKTYFGNIIIELEQ